MFPFNKKSPPEASKNDSIRERVNKTLDDTHNRLEVAIQEMKRRLEEKERRQRVAGVR